MNLFKYGNYSVEYDKYPSYGYFELYKFHITSNALKEFDYEVKITSSLKWMLINNAIYSRFDYDMNVRAALLEHVKLLLDKRHEKDDSKDFRSDDYEEFVCLVKRAKKISISDEILNYLYHIHFELFNSNNTPVGIGIIADDLKKDTKTIYANLVELQNKELIEIVALSKTNKYARITPKGIKILGKSNE